MRNDDLNIEVDLDSVIGASSLEITALRTEIRRLQRRIAGFEAANAELSAANDPAGLEEVWRKVSTWGFEDAHPGDGVLGILDEAEAAGAAHEAARAALGRLKERLRHLRHVPCRDCVIIPCPACTEAAGAEPAAGVVRRAPLDEKRG